MIKVVHVVSTATNNSRGREHAQGEIGVPGHPPQQAPANHVEGRAEKEGSDKNVSQHIDQEQRPEHSKRALKAGAGRPMVGTGIVQKEKLENVGP